MNSVAPVWDGNETWLVLGGGGLMAAFPLAYAIILPALYAPIIAMLLALIFRGVAFEFRWRDPGHRRLWDVAFTTGSIVATLAQGITLGALLQGISVRERAYGGGWWDWLTPFSLLVGVSLVIGYALLGATWLIMKTDGSAQENSLSSCRGTGTRNDRLHRARQCRDTVSQRAPTTSAGSPGRKSLFTRSGASAGRDRIRRVFLSLRRRREYWPFLLALTLFALCLLGLGVSMFPYRGARAP